MTDSKYFTTTKKGTELYLHQFFNCLIDYVINIQFMDLNKISFNYIPKTFFLHFNVYV